MSTGFGRRCVAGVVAVGTELGGALQRPIEQQGVQRWFQRHSRCVRGAEGREGVRNGSRGCRCYKRAEGREAGTVQGQQGCVSG